MGNGNGRFGTVEPVISGPSHLVAVEVEGIVGFGDLDHTGYLDRPICS